MPGAAEKARGWYQPSYFGGGENRNRGSYWGNDGGWGDLFRQMQSDRVNPQNYGDPYSWAAAQQTPLEEPMPFQVGGFGTGRKPPARLPATSAEFVSAAGEGIERRWLGTEEDYSAFRGARQQERGAAGESLRSTPLGMGNLSQYGTGQLQNRGMGFSYGQSFRRR